MLSSILKKIESKYSIVTSDFKTVEKKFLDQGEDKTEIKKYLDLFKKLRDKNKLSTEEKNIDLWAKKPFKDFKKRLGELEKVKTATEKRKGAIEVEKKIPGALKLAENKDWVVYEITTNDASAELGQGTEWCIKHKNSNHWDDYSSKNNIYFILSKNRGKDDLWFKIALLVDFNGEKTYWDKLDDDHTSIPSDLNIPKFKTEKPKFFVTIGGKKYDLENLPEGLKVGGSLYLHYTPIKSLPKGLKVGGDLNLSGTPIESLPKGLTVGGYLNLGNTPIKSLPEGLKVGGFLDLYNTQITSLPEGLKVGGNLYLDGTPIKSLPKSLTVGGELCLGGTPITSLPDDLDVNGDIYVYNPAKIQCSNKLKGKLRR